MYKLTTTPDTIIRIEDGACIPKGHRWYAEYEEWLSQGNTPAPADPVPNPRIAEIKNLLAQIDTKRIRPLAEGDTAFLEQLTAQAVALRAELQGL